MRAYRLCRSKYAPYDGEGAWRVGGRWNSRGTRVLYMSENRSLAVLEILVHLSSAIPDKYLLGIAEIPVDVATEEVSQRSLPADWAVLDPHRQPATRRIGDEWVAEERSAILAVPSVVSGERNLLLNPAHPHFGRIAFAKPLPFAFDIRLFSRREGMGAGEARAPLSSF